MKACIIQQIHQPPILTDKPIPTLSENEALISIKASALNHRDVYITQGLYPGIKLGATMGADGSGTDTQGRQVVINPGLDWGSNQAYQAKSFRVLGVPDEGTFADFIAINKKYVYPMPEHLTFLEAAALPLAGLTAYRSVFKRAHLQAGDKVLISGVGGGVALFALQFALAIGCQVAVTSSSEQKLEKALSLGAHYGYSYKDETWTKKIIADMQGVDVVVDSAGGPGFINFIRIANPGGRIVFYGGTHGNIDGVNPQQIFWKQLSILGSTMGSDEDFSDMLDFVNQHKIKPVISNVFGFTDIVSGFDVMKQGSQMGKIVFDHSH
ncbi:MAG: zinc-binding dehydrogenase [Chitinophagales bacterium]|nr:zinc-binding dehydrogenase [Chitinophagales bacterium]